MGGKRRFVNNLLETTVRTQTADGNRKHRWLRCPNRLSGASPILDLGAIPRVALPAANPPDTLN